MAAYDILKDFSGPFATVVAASTAAYLTWSIQTKNYDLAKNKLRLDLFDKRYKVYASARDLLLLMMTNPEPNASETNLAILKHYLAMNEGQFVCSVEAQDFCRQVMKAHQNWLGAKLQLQYIDSSPASEKHEIVNNWTNCMSEMLRLGGEAAKHFVSDLKLSE